MLGLYVQMQPALGDLLREVQPPIMLYMNPEAGKVPYMPPVTIGRVYFDNEQARLSSDPLTFAREASKQCIELARKTNIPVWMGTNEPDVSSTSAMERLVGFEKEFTQRLNAEGLRAAVFSLSVGWPRQIEGTTKLDTAPLDAFLHTLHPMNFVALHEYFTPSGVYGQFTYPDGRVVTPYTKTGPSLCWRFKWWPQLDSHNVIITECGMDIWGRPKTDGWRAQCPMGMNLEQWFDCYVSFMSEYMALVSQDPRFLGAVWFSAGPGYGWEQYDWLDHWKQARVLLSGPVPELPDITSIPTTTNTIRVKIVNTDEIKTLPLEEYLRGVVPSEMPALWNAEALKAQAVLARSYAMACVLRNSSKSYDVNDTVAYQVYNPSRIHPNSDAAVQETAGVYLVEDGKPFLAEYKKYCGREDCTFCNGNQGTVVKGNFFGVWPNQACQYGMNLLAEEGMEWREIAKRYYRGVRLSDEDG